MGAEAEAVARPVLEAWARAFVQADVEALVALHAAGAGFIGTTSAEPGNGHAAVRLYFEEALRGRKPVRAEWLQVRSFKLAEGLVAVEALDVVAWAGEGGEVAWPGRVSLVLRREAAGWRIAQFHRSALPG